jgi:hypothetical protein
MAGVAQVELTLASILDVALVGEPRGVRQVRTALMGHAGDRYGT